MRGSRYLLLATLVALAGCAGVLGGDTGATATPTATTTETAAPTPTATPSPTATPTATPTPTTTEPGIDPETRSRYRALNDRVDEKTVSLVDSKVINETTVGYIVDQNTNQTLDQMFHGEAMPVPQAVALEVVKMDEPPERVVFHIIDNDRARIFTSSFSLEDARAYENRTLMPNEFRNLLEARGKVYNNGSKDDLKTLLIWETGDRARQSYIKGIVEAARSKKLGTKLNITDTNLHNESYNFSDDGVHIKEGTSISITVQHPRDGGNESYAYGFFNEDLRAATAGVLLDTWGEVAYYRAFGNPPGGLRIRYDDPDGTLYMTEVIADDYGSAYESGQIGPITLIKKTKVEYYNGGTETEQRGE